MLKRSESIILVIPSLVYVFMLPGFLYFDLAFDIQRSIFVELLMSTLPPSAIALLLRHVFSHEAIGIAVTWTFPGMFMSLHDSE